MKSEQLFEIDRQISQIRKGIEQRQERVAEWNVPLNSILKARPPPQKYLSKKYSDSRISHYESMAEGGVEEARKMLKEHLAESRIRTKAHRNELKELDLLVKKRNMIRVIKLREETQKENIQPLAPLSEVPVPQKKQMMRNTYDGQEKFFQRGEKDHSLLSGVRGQKILQIVQEGKQRGASGEEVAGILKRHLGIGIENTPFYTWMERRFREQKSIVKVKSVNKGLQKAKSFDFFRTMQRDIRPRKDIYLSRQTDLSANFQHRLMNIIRYHQNNVNSICS